MYTIVGEGCREGESNVCIYCFCLGGERVGVCDLGSEGRVRVCVCVQLLVRLVWMSWRTRQYVNGEIRNERSRP